MQRVIVAVLMAFMSFCAQAGAWGDGSFDNDLLRRFGYSPG